MNTKYSVYNKEKIYEKEIEAKIQEIKKICAQHDIPFLATFAVANDEKGTTYKNDGIGIGTLGIQLTDDKFSKYLCVNNGFDVKIPGVENGYNGFDELQAETFDDDELEKIPDELL